MSRPATASVSVSSAAAVSRPAPAGRSFRTAYIIGPRADAFWFLGLPFLALAAALAGQAWLSAVAVASVALWIDVPHQFVTLLRTFGVAADRRQFWSQLIIGMIVIAAIMAGGLAWAPLSLLLVSTLWNHQHQLMQLHGFSRVYDFKAKAGEPATANWDLALAWVLYGNLFITAPLFTRFWLRELYRFGISLTAFDVRLIHGLAWFATGLFTLCYVVFVLRSLRRGAVVNPLKYAFILCNYSVLYFVSWQTSSILIYGIANIIMHGLQYMVFVYVYLQRQEAKTGQHRSLVNWLVRPGHLAAFVCLLVAYIVLYQLMSGRPLDELGFGAIHLASQYDAVPDVRLRAMTPTTGEEIWLLTLLNVPGMLHLYYDSFIWKVRRPQTQGGL